MKDHSVHSKVTKAQTPTIRRRNPRSPFSLGLSTTPHRKLCQVDRARERSKWRPLWVALAASIFIAICTDGYLFALAVSVGLSFSVLTMYLRSQRVDRRRYYLHLEWLLLSYSLPILAITALLPLQVQWYRCTSNALPHIGLHLFFPTMGTLVTTCLLERYCLSKITMSPGERSERRPHLAISNRLQWFAWIAFRVACAAGAMTCGTLLVGPILFTAYFPALSSSLLTVATAEGSACFICLAIIFICAIVDLRRDR